MDMIFPSNIKCIYCKSPIKKTNPYSLCKRCFERIEFRNDDKNICTRYQGLMVKLIHRFKYFSATYLAEIFAEMIQQKMEAEGMEADYLTCIPTSKKRMRTRGYNQSALLCQSLSRRSDIPYVEMLERVKDTAPLASMDPVQRAMELSGAFRVREDIPKIQGKKILIIDDILTTGVTMGEAIDLLESAEENVQVDFMVLSSKKIY